MGKYRDTEFGGKTGTSNNHSDAWFMCVSPNLVAGAWVGGEYRSIHFRTGALGQGSRTALPITGYFMQAVLADPAFKKYHGKFKKPDDAGITPDMYMCQSYYPPVHNDSIHSDSTIVSDQEIFLDENGNPIEGKTTAAPTQEPKESKGTDGKTEKRRRSTEEVNFDDL